MPHKRRRADGAATQEAHLWTLDCLLSTRHVQVKVENTGLDLHELEVREDDLHLHLHEFHEDGSS
mgnify:CR=1 FL=1